MHKTYKIVLDGTEIETSRLEKADAPMGVVWGEIAFQEIPSPYRLFKDHFVKHGIAINADDPEHGFLDTQTISGLQVFRQDEREIKGIAGNSITGMEEEGYEISIMGIAYPFFAEEFPHHVG
ncbi:MAG: hypothetical protein AAF206_04225 [Bacteroidota bacterium]